MTLLWQHLYDLYDLYNLGVTTPVGPVGPGYDNTFLLFLRDENMIET